MLFFIFLLGPEIKEFWSILIVKQYFAECFCAGILAGSGPSWINKYDNKPTVGVSKSLF